MAIAEAARKVLDNIDKMYADSAYKWTREAEWAIENRRHRFAVDCIISAGENLSQIDNLNLASQVRDEIISQLERAFRGTSP